MSKEVVMACLRHYHDIRLQDLVISSRSSGGIAGLREEICTRDLSNMKQKATLSTFD
jgi:hypothetical protein